MGTSKCLSEGYTNYIADLLKRFLLTIMNIRISTLIVLVCFSTLVSAQQEQTYIHEGEFGFSAGLGQYFGDINPNSVVKHTKFAASAFYLKQLNNYISLKAGAHYSFLGYSDKYSTNLHDHTRNLSFNSDVWEVSLSGNFNFFKFYPQLEEYRFTPYLSLGVGAINYNPYTYYGDQKVYLRQYKTEGQDVQYSSFAFVVPIGFGVKYNISNHVNIFSEIIYRFTSTGYLDDVNGTYAGADAFKDAPIAKNLQDRSYIYGDAVGKKGYQRGNGKNDSYATFEIGLSFNLEGYSCPVY